MTLLYESFKAVNLLICLQIYKYKFYKRFQNVVQICCPGVRRHPYQTQVNLPLFFIIRPLCIIFFPLFSAIFSPLVSTISFIPLYVIIFSTLFCPRLLNQQQQQQHNLERPIGLIRPIVNVAAGSRPITATSIKFGALFRLEPTSSSSSLSALDVVEINKIKFGAL